MNMKPWGADMAISLTPTPTLEEWAGHAEQLDLPARIGDTHGRIDIYLSSLRFLLPRDLCCARLIIELAAAAAAEVHVHAPDSANVHTYATRLNLYRALPANVTLTRQPATIRRRDRRSRLIELDHVTDEAGLHELSDHVADVARRSVRRRHRRLFRHGVVEVADNVFEHADSFPGAFVAAQRYRDRLEIAVVDAGRGIQASLATRSEYADLTEIEAVQAVLEHGATRRPDSAGGGLRSLQELLADQRGSTFELATGSIIARIGSETPNAYRTTTTHVPGTWVTITIKMKG